MTFTPTSLQGNFLITLNRIGDERGWFMRTYNKDDFAQIGLDPEWLQMNHSFTAEKGTVRGMHFQNPPFAEIKLVRCVRGKVWDVAVDLRKSSSTYLKWFAAELSPENNQMMYIPEGFAHGFQALEDNSELVYMHSQVYTPGAEGGLRYDDPLLNIQWPLAPKNISERDRSHPLITDQYKSNF